MAIAATIFLCVLVTWAMIIYLNKVKYLTDIRSLKQTAEGNDVTRFNPTMVAGLPEPVQRYLLKVIPEGFPIIQFVELTHTGTFKTNPSKGWVDIKGTQYFTTQRPGFIWRGKTTLFQADDRYFADEGRLKVRLFSVIPIVTSKGTQIDEGELQRWMGEHSWFPTNLLNQNLFRWEVINDQSSQLTLHYKDFSIPMTIDFNEDDLIETVTCMRFKENGKRMKWSGKVSHYKHFNGLLAPTRVQARWHLPDELYTYADFKVTSLHIFPSPEKDPTVSPMEANVPKKELEKTW